ncbi:hypothetical protein Hanom_Chr04g00312601 [Helianthus anomalus]
MHLHFKLDGIMVTIQTYNHSQADPPPIPKPTPTWRIKKNTPNCPKKYIVITYYLFIS